jgi:hypothetical protein
MRRLLGIVAAALLGLVALGASQAQGPAAPAKLALVIGVSDYGKDRAAQEAAGFVVPGPLANAVRDSQRVAAAP